MEKPKMPCFAGDVRDHAIFWTNFRHAVDCRYGKRDAIRCFIQAYKGDHWN